MVKISYWTDTHGINPRRSSSARSEFSPDDDDDDNVLLFGLLAP